MVAGAGAAGAAAGTGAAAVYVADAADVVDSIGVVAATVVVGTPPFPTPAAAGTVPLAVAAGQAAATDTGTPPPPRVEVGGAGVLVPTTSMAVPAPSPTPPGAACGMGLDQPAPPGPAAPTLPAPANATASAADVCSRDRLPVPPRVAPGKGGKEVDAISCAVAVGHGRHTQETIIRRRFGGRDRSRCDGVPNLVSMVRNARWLVLRYQTPDEVDPCSTIGRCLRVIETSGQGVIYGRVGPRFSFMLCYSRNQKSGKVAQHCCSGEG